MGLTVSDIQNKQATCIILTERITNITKPKDNNDTLHTLANCQKPSPWYEENFGL